VAAAADQNAPPRATVREMGAIVRVIYGERANGLFGIPSLFMSPGMFGRSCPDGLSRISDER
jgi:hypothetical protein